MDPDADSDPDSEGDPETALDPGLDGVFSSSREIDLDPAPSVSLDPGLISYLASNLEHDLDWDIASDLISDLNLDSGQATSRCPFSRIAAASREIPCADPVAVALGWR